MADHRWSTDDAPLRSRQARRPLLALAAAAVALLLAGGVAAANVPSGRTPYVPPAGPVAVDIVTGTPCTTSARACVDLDTHNAWLIRDGKVTRAVTFVDGDVATPTPTGTFKVEWKAENWVSREYNSPMPYSVFFAPGGVAFHEGGQKTPSAGCVKLVMDDAKAFFADLQVGDEVQVR